jgi:uncharacterized LabA/DUF88 family protein
MSKLRAIVFIDGNNLYHNLRALGVKPSSLDFYKLGELVCEHFECDFEGSRYYNSVPNIRDDSVNYHKHMLFLDELVTLPKFELLTRKLQSYTTKSLQQEKKIVVDGLDLCPACKPIVENNCLECIGRFRKKEKGIDVMIAVDMLNLSVIEQKCDCCILVSGDADFVPASQIVNKHGKAVYSTFIPKGYSWELRKNLKFWTLSKDFLLESCMKGPQS